MGDAEIEAGDQDLVACGEARIARALDRSREIDAEHQRVLARHPPFSQGRQPVLIVDAGIGNANSDVTP